MSRDNPRATCETCAFFDAATFSCRARPPSVIGSVVFYPLVLTTDWCGEHAFAKEYLDCHTVDP